MVQYFHKLIKIIPQILKLLGIKTLQVPQKVGITYAYYHGVWGIIMKPSIPKVEKKARRFAPRQRAYGLRPSKRAVRPLFGPSAQTNSNVKSRLYSLFKHQFQKPPRSNTH